MIDQQTCFVGTGLKVSFICSGVLFELRRKEPNFVQRNEQENKEFQLNEILFSSNIKFPLSH